MATSLVGLPRLYRMASSRKPKPKQTTSPPTRGRIWLRATDEEWAAISKAAESEGMGNSEWIISILVAEAKEEKRAGHFSYQGGYKRHRILKDVVLRDKETIPNRNIYCLVEEQHLIGGVARFYNKSVNGWAMRLLLGAAKESELRHMRIQNLVVTENQHRITPELEAQIKAGNIPDWLKHAMKIARANEKK